MKSKIILCTGGARSGKSEFAERYILGQKGRKGYVATAQIFDAEMQARVDAHQERRGREWENFEIPYNLPDYWDTISAQCDIILVDCLTMYVTNALLRHEDWEKTEVSQKIEQEILEDLENLFALVEKSENKLVVFVTNELGMGIVPENKLARVFRDIAGRVNALTAAHASEVYLTIAGITIEIKAREVHL